MRGKDVKMEKPNVEISDIVKTTFKARSKKQLDYILQILRKTFGQQNVNSLSPIYIYRARIWVLDVDINIPDTLLRYNFDSKEAPET